MAARIKRIHPPGRAGARRKKRGVADGHRAPGRGWAENLLLGAQHELKNRCLHVDYQVDAPFQSAAAEASKCNNCTLDCTLEELAVLRVIAAIPTITQKDLAAAIGKSERTIKTCTVALQEKGYLRREGGKRNGYWEVQVELS